MAKKKRTRITETTRRRGRHRLSLGKPRPRDAMFAATHTVWAPWYIADADDKKRARLNIISHLLSQVPYKPLAHPNITLPRRQPRGGYMPPDLPLRRIPTPF